MALAATDILTGLQTGMIDGTPTTPLLALTLQWYRQHAAHGRRSAWRRWSGGLVITKQAWSKISPADQAKVLAACQKLEKTLADRRAAAGHHRGRGDEEARAQ